MPRFVNFVLFTRDRILTNETQSNCFIPLSYSLIYIGCVKSYSAKFVRNHSLIRYFLHCDWLLPSTDLKVHSRLRWLCKPINVHNVHTHHLTCVTHESKSPTYELIINRSELPHDLSPDQLEELWICEKHRGNMGKNWQPRRTCQYPLHNGRKKQLNTRNAVHLDMSREINTIFSEFVPTGSRKYDFYVNSSLSTRYCPEMRGRV